MHMHHVPPSDLPCASTTLRKASRAIARLFDEALSSCGVTTVQFSLLRTVRRAGGEGRALSRLAEEMVMDRTTLYRALTPMRRHGWIAIADAATGRAKIVTLTDEGQATLDLATLRWKQAQSRVVEAFGVDRWAAFQDGIAELAAIGVRLAG